MRPIALTLSAFGPFQNAETVQFDRLGDNPLFLINGPTGSGKTTLLDAICFALYGRTTGDEREGSQMRCDHALPDTLTFVEFSFELAQHCYRIRRVPEQQRPKSRGEGTTTQSAEAQLWQLDSPEGERLLVANKVTDATREIEQLTSLSVEQFRQVMVLPQGKFRDLLMAESKAREAIFSQLFQTHVYQQLEERLKLQSAEIRRTVEKQSQIQQGILDGAGVADKITLLEKIAQLKPEVARAKSAHHAAEEQYRVATIALQSAQHLKEAFGRLETLQLKMEALECQQPVIVRERQQLQRSEQASQIHPLYQTMHRCKQELKRTEQEWSKVQAEEVEARNCFEQATAALEQAEQLIPESDAAKLSLASLEGYQQRAVRLDAVLARQSEVTLSCNALIKKQQAASAEYKKHQAAVVSTEEQRIVVQQLIQSLHEAPLQLQRVSEQLKERSSLDQLIDQQAGQQKKLAEAEIVGKRLADTYEAALKESQSLELAWHQGQAAWLAQELKQDQPCPVCGSDAHPNPAIAEAKLPTEAELTQAKQRVHQANEKLSEARKGYAELNGSITERAVQIERMQQQQGVSLQITLTQLQEQHALLQQAVTRLKEAQQTLIALDDGYRKQQILLSDLHQNLEVINRSVADQQADLSAVKSEVSSAEQELPGPYRQPGALNSAIQGVKQQIIALERSIDVARAGQRKAHGQWEASQATEKRVAASHVAARDADLTAETEWGIALVASPFETLEVFLEALMDAASQAKLKESIQTFEQAFNKNMGALHDQQLALADAQPPDLLHLEQSLEQVAETKRLAESEWHQKDKQLGQLLNAEETFRKSEQQCEAHEAEYRLIGTLSDVANGQTGDKISLQRFVLSVLLDDVLVEASHRLYRMSKGRYQLFRKVERSKGNKASGLELEVEDGYTGNRRPVATLSGGESFLAALSLALGLSDVVQAYSGGIRLDTLFIDEGFGSLDPESLDLAIRTLIDLQASGRMIGVISHVAELKEQMPLRLDIVPSRAGSHVTLVRP